MPGFSEKPGITHSLGSLRCYFFTDQAAKRWRKVAEGNEGQPADQAEDQVA